MKNRTRIHSFRHQLLLAAVLLFAQAGAFAHLVDHVADLYDQSCLVCVVAHQFDHVAGTPQAAALVETAPHFLEVCTVQSVNPTRPVLRPPQRAPPVSTGF